MKKALPILFGLLLLCACGLLFSAPSFGGSALAGLQDVFGYTSQGIPPGGGSCANVGQLYEDNPFYGWPVNYRYCDWAVISAYYCTPNYFAGYTHWGIDLSNYWGEVSEAIHGVEIIATIDKGRVLQAVHTVPAQFNYGMGNFVQVVSQEAICEVDVQEDLDGDGIIGEYCGVACEEELDVDLNGDDQITDYCGEEGQWKATYMHLLDVSVSPGQIVNFGDVMGHVNNSGNSTGDHLHYQINGPEGTIDPGPTFACPGYDWDAGVEAGG